MAVALTPGQARTLTLATTVTRLTGIGSCRELTITAPAATDVFIVDDPAVADGATLPTHYLRIPAGQIHTFRLAPSTAYLGLAAGAGTPACHVRPL